MGTFTVFFIVLNNKNDNFGTATSNVEGSKLKRMNCRENRLATLRTWMPQDDDTHRIGLLFPITFMPILEQIVCTA